MTHARALRALLPAAALAALLTGCAFGSPSTRGQRALERGEYEAALAAYNEAIDQGDALAISYANRCIANDALRRHDEAVADCTRSLEVAEEEGAPEGFREAEVLNNRGVAYLNRRAYEDAVADFDAAIELEEDYAEAFANRGRAYLDMEDFEQAIQDLDRAIELDPEMSEAFGNRGLAYQFQGDDERAIEEFGAAIAIDNSPQAYSNRAMLYYTLGEFDEAEADYEAVMRFASPGSFIYYMAQTQREFLGNRDRSTPDPADLEEADSEEGESVDVDAEEEGAEGGAEDGE